MLDSFFEALFSDTSLKPIALESLRRTGKPNDALFSDASEVSLATDGDAVVVSGLDLAAIHEAIRAYAEDEKGGYAREITDLSGLFIIRTPTLRFPDGLYYWMTETEAGLKVSLYARAVYGRSDFGVNRGHLDAVAARLAN